MNFLGTLKNIFLDSKMELQEMFSDFIPHQTEFNPQTIIDNFLYGYGEKFHCQNEQYARFNRAMDPDKIGHIRSLDRVHMRMRIAGSYHPEKTYAVRLNKCECKDFEERQLPCKHIYRLALEIGIVSPDWDLSGLSPEIKSSLSALSEPQQKALLRLMNTQGNRNTFFSSKKQSVPRALIKEGFIIEEEQPETIDKHYKKQELLSMLSLSSKNPMKESDKKNAIIEYLIFSEPKLAKTLCEKFYTIKYSEQLSQNFEYIRRYLVEKYN